MKHIIYLMLSFTFSCETFQLMAAESINIVENRVSNTQEATPPTEYKYAPHSFDPDLTLKIYQLVYDFQTVMNRSQIPFFFTSGTLLGAVRHGGLIPWDDDADCYMLKEHRVDFEENIIPLLKGLGYVVRNADSPVAPCYKVDVREKGKLITFLDVHFMDKDEEKEEYYFKSTWPVLQRIRLKHEDIFPLQMVKFGEINITTVNNVNKILTQPYGENWRTHVKKYNHLYKRLLTPEDKKTQRAKPHDLLPAGPFGPIKNDVIIKWKEPIAQRLQEINEQLTSLKAETTVTQQDISKLEAKKHSFSIQLTQLQEQK